MAVTDLFGMIAKGELKPVIGGTYGLDEVADAHRALLSRSTPRSPATSANR